MPIIKIQRWFSKLMWGYASYGTFSKKPVGAVYYYLDYWFTGSVKAFSYGRNTLHSCDYAFLWANPGFTASIV